MIDHHACFVFTATASWVKKVYRGKIAIFRQMRYCMLKIFILPFNFYS